MQCPIFLLMVAALFPYIVSAAEIEVLPTGTPVDMIIVRGEIQTGDAERFLRATSDVRVGAVLLESPGGALVEGLHIGENINQKGFTTGVAPDNVCASACALAWLAGAERFMDSTALIGLHSAYVVTDGVASESGIANGLVGAYLTRLGLGIDAIVFATSAGPTEIN